MLQEYGLQTVNMTLTEQQYLYHCVGLSSEIGTTQFIEL